MVMFSFRNELNNSIWFNKINKEISKLKGLKNNLIY